MSFARRLGFHLSLFKHHLASFNLDFPLDRLHSVRNTVATDREKHEDLLATMLKKNALYQALTADTAEDKENRLAATAKLLGHSTKMHVDTYTKHDGNKALKQTCAGWLLTRELEQIGSTDCSADSPDNSKMRL
uniref:Integrase n=1 Tax=Globodera pallida TaxID=36090 RepID=A0A183C3G3_GLOPA